MNGRSCIAGVALLALAPLHYSSFAQTPRALVATRDLYVDASTADLSRVTSLLVGRNGDIIMRMMSDGNIRYFDSKGVPFTFGRQGDGPYEFRNLREGGMLGDTVWMADIGSGRVSIISPTRAPMRMYDYPRVIRTPGSSGPFETSASFPVAIYADGSHLMWVSTVLQGSAGGGAAVAKGSSGTATTSGAASSGAANAAAAAAAAANRAASNARFTPPPWFPKDSSSTLGYVRVKSDGQFMRVVAWIPAPPDCGVRFNVASGGIGQALIPFCTAPPTTVASDGEHVAMITGVNPRAPSGTYRVVVVNSGGDTVLARAIAYRAVAIPKSKTDSVIATRIEQMNGRPGFAEAYHSMQTLTHYPPVRAILVGRDRTIWLEQWTPAAERSWRVMDMRGNIIATLKLPANITILAADMTTVWGTETDVDGLNSVVRYKLGGG